MNATRTFRDYLSTKVRDPAEAAAYLSAALDQYEEDGNREAFLLALRTVVEAQGGIAEVARRTGLNRQHLYRAFSGRGNPTWSTLDTVLGALGFRLEIKPLRHAHAS